LLYKINQCLEFSVFSSLWLEKHMSITQHLGIPERILEELKNVREHELFLWTLWNAISSSYSGNQITCKPSLISLYVAAVVMVWQLIECPQSSKRAITGFKTFLWYGLTQNLSLLWRNYRKKHDWYGMLPPLERFSHNSKPTTNK